MDELKSSNSGATSESSTLPTAGTGSESESEPEEALGTPSLNLADCSSLSVYSKSKPNHILTGLSNGACDLAVGTVGCVLLSVIIPAKAMIEGYNNFGIKGVAVGGLIGLPIGALCGGVLLAGGVISCSYQVTMGLIRSPEALYATLTGKQWDALTEEWVPINLSDDEQRFLDGLSTEDFKADYLHATTEKIKAALYDHSTASSGNNEGNDDSHAQTKTSQARPLKNVSDRTLYDLLGVEPNANGTEIKKAYYVKARECHPDRCRNDPQAHQRFQQIGQAYQLLSDPQLRSVYDSQGKAAMEDQSAGSSMDAAVLYSLLFGSEKFESIIGELQVTMYMRAVVSQDSSLLSSSKYPLFVQRKREVRLAVALADRLRGFGDEHLQASWEEEATELASMPLGAALLTVIGEVYESQAQAALQPLLSGLPGNVGRFFQGFGSFFSAAYYGVSAVTSSLDFYQHQQALKEQQEPAGTAGGKETKKDPLQRIYSPTADASDEEKAAFKSKTEKMLSSTIRLLWQLSKEDIEKTLTAVCKRVLNDEGASPELKTKRARGLLLLGKTMKAKGGEVAAGLLGLLELLEARSGILDPNVSAAAGDAGSSGSGGYAHAP